MSEPLLPEWDGERVEDLTRQWGIPALEAYARLGSTSDRALDLAAHGCEAYTVVIADEQTQGRGRRGASWHSAPAAGLWMSVVLPPCGVAPHVSLLVGLSAATGIEAVADVRVGLEWPNDLVTGTGKVGGILCEGADGRVVAGIGVNVRAPRDGFPPSLEGRATALEVEVSKKLSRKELASSIVSDLKRRVTHVGGRLEAADLSALSARDALADRPVLTEAHGTGTARGIAADGALVLERPDGSRVRVMAGSVRAL